MEESKTDRQWKEHEGEVFLEDTSENDWKKETTQSIKQKLCDWIDSELEPKIYSQEVDDKLYFIIKNIFVSKQERELNDQSDMYFSIEQVDKEVSC